MLDYLDSVICCYDFPGASDGKESTCNEGEPCSVLGLGTSPEEGNGYPLQYSCLENSMDRGTWWATGITKSWTWLSDSLPLLWHIYIILIVPINCILIHYDLFRCIRLCVNHTSPSSLILPRSRGVVLRSTSWRSWSQTARMWIWLLFPSYMTLGKFLNFSILSFPIWE